MRAIEIKIILLANVLVLFTVYSAMTAQRNKKKMKLVTLNVNMKLATRMSLVCFS